MSLRDGSKKMSKSDPSDLSRINMSDDADSIAQKFRKAKTDPDALPSEEAGLENRPEARNLVVIYAALEDQSLDEVLNDIGGKQFSEFKPMLIDRAVATLSPISAEMNRLMQEPDEIDRVLADGAERARKIAQPILNQTYDIMGLLRS
jgi:tryptophanyl-tRNA synthetase